MGYFPGNEHWFSCPTHTQTLEHHQSEIKHLSTGQDLTSLHSCCLKYQQGKKGLSSLGKHM